MQAIFNHAKDLPPPPQTNRGVIKQGNNGDIFNVYSSQLRSGRPPTFRPGDRHFIPHLIIVTDLNINIMFRNHFMYMRAKAG